MTLFPVHVGTYIHTYTWLTIKILIPFLQTHFIWSHVYTIDLYLLRVQVLVCTMWHMNSKWLLVVNTTSTAAAATTSAAAATAIMCKNWVGIGPMLAARGRYQHGCGMPLHPSGPTMQWYRHYEVKTTLWHRFDVILTLSLRRVPVAMGTGSV